MSKYEQATNGPAYEAKKIVLDSGNVEKNFWDSTTNNQSLRISSKDFKISW